MYTDTDKDLCFMIDMVLFWVGTRYPDEAGIRDSLISIQQNNRIYWENRKIL